MTSTRALPNELHVLIPFWGMAGGVIKILDYAHHAASGGVARVTLWAPRMPEPDNMIHTLPVLSSLEEASNVSVRSLDDLRFDSNAEPWVLFTEPTHHALIERAAHRPLGARLIHLIQGTRHANPSWSDGRNYRLLHRPMSRIFVTDQVADAVAPLVNRRFITRSILEGHDGGYFAAGAPERTTTRSVFRVLYPTWKGDLGDRVASVLADDPSFTFDAIRGDVGWPELRRRYHAADLFICAPGPEEGFYLPGLEAMAAGCAVVSASVGGNESYLEEGHNVVHAAFDDADAHAQAIRRIAGDAELRRALISGGRATVELHRLDREREQFLNMLASLAEAPNSQG